MGPTWGPSGADRTQVGPMLAPWTLLSDYDISNSFKSYLQFVRRFLFVCCIFIVIAVKLFKKGIVQIDSYLRFVFFFVSRLVIFGYFWSLLGYLNTSSVVLNKFCGMLQAINLTDDNSSVVLNRFCAMLQAINLTDDNLLPRDALQPSVRFEWNAKVSFFFKKMHFKISSAIWLSVC